jgi:oligosaccharide repeat unit polymerase
MLLGHKIKPIKSSFSWMNIPNNSYCNRISLLTTTFAEFSIIGLIISFFVMGFVPAFASNPLAAKFFRDEYQDSYAKVAVLFRTCNYLLQFIIPLLLVLWYSYRKKKYLLLLAISLTILAFCLARSPAFSGIILGIGIIVASSKRKLFKYYILLLVLIYSIGSVVYSLLDIMIGKEIMAYQNITIWEMINNGAPDIIDQLHFLTAFTDQPEYTYGRTFYGGLVPSHYYWNPGVWTLSVVTNGAEVNNLISGGLRLPLPMWGYVSFSWIGVVVVSLFVGFLAGIFIKKTQRLLQGTNNIVIQTIIILLYMNVYSFFINFHLMSMYKLPILFIMIFYLYNIKLISKHTV